MNKMYGEQSFKKGFEIFMSNRQILKEEDGEDKMADLLNSIELKTGLQPAGEEATITFINYCQQHIISNNYIY